MLPRGTSGSETRRYRIIGVLGRGGFGTVYHARLEGSDDFVKDVAIKLLTDANPAPETLSRFRDEARILGRLRDRSIVSVDPPTRLDGRWGVVMEYVDGVDCRRLIRQNGRLPPTVALQIVEEVARTLDNLWSHPGEDGQPMCLLHRDLKPSNLQITPAGAVKVLDFGVARADFGQRETSTTAHIAGTVGYIAPERGEGIEDPRGDVFSLGVVLEELVTGRRPMRPGESSRSAPKQLSRTQEPRSSASPLSARSRSGTPGPSTGLGRPSQRLAANSIPGAQSYEDGGYRGSADDRIPPEVLRFALEMRAADPNDRPYADEVEQRCAALVRSLEGPTLREWARDHVHHAPLSGAQTQPDALVGQMLSETLARVDFDKGPAPRGNQAFAAALLIVSVSAALLVLLLGLGSIGGAMWWWSNQRAEQNPVAIAPGIPPGLTVEPVPATPEVAPVAGPEPARPPRPRPPRPLAPVLETGMVTQEGAVSISLSGDEGSFEAGKVPVGTYDVSATFDDSGAVPAGTVTVTAGSRIQLRCDARFKRCMQR